MTSTKISIITIGLLLALFFLLTACNQEKIPPVPQQPDQNQVSEPASSIGIQITPEEEADGLDLAIKELEETDA